jgi:very-short-patch-repair endonuclease
MNNPPSTRPLTPALSPEGRGGMGGAVGDPSPLWGEGGSTKSSRVRGRKVTANGVEKARVLRRTQTEAERRMWNLLRNRGVEGLKFVRQHPIDPFVVDFLCRELMLVVEVDGSQHVDDAQYDGRRTAFLNERGYSVLRFWNGEAIRHADGICRMLTALKAGLLPGPSPGWRYSPATLSPEGRGEVTAPIRDE